MRSFNRWAHRAWLRLTSRRDSKKGLQLLKIKGKRIVLKRAGLLDEERQARRVIAEYCKNNRSDLYSLTLSKRYPIMRGSRVEQYYDSPTLFEVLAKRKTPQVLRLAERTGRSLDQLSEMGDRVERQLFGVDFHRLYKLHRETKFDPGSDQVLVDMIDKNGKMHLILIDI